MRGDEIGTPLGSVTDQRTSARAAEDGERPAAVPGRTRAPGVLVDPLGVLRRPLRPPGGEQPVAVLLVSRGIAIVSAVIVPSLVGLNLAGVGNAVVQWSTFALSLVAAVSAAIPRAVPIRRPLVPLPNAAIRPHGRGVGADSRRLGRTRDRVEVVRRGHRECDRSIQRFLRLASGSAELRR